VEGEGVSPDIEVIDRPELIAAGKDPCIEKAVEVLLEQLKKKPLKTPAMPAEPDRSKWIEKESK
jgi:tricorn protease